MLLYVFEGQCWINEGKISGAAANFTQKVKETVSFVVKFKSDCSRQQNTFKKKSIVLTDDKDGERVVHWSVAVGGLKGINSTFWHFQAHQLQLTAVAKDAEKESICHWSGLPFGHKLNGFL